MTWTGDGQGGNDSLECDHCGGVAVVADDDGMYYENRESECMSCGMPGRISFDEVEEDDASYTDATWLVSWVESDKCNRKECEECNG